MEARRCHNYLLTIVYQIMDLSSLEVLPIHKHPQYLKSCCHLINDEWPRSETARMMSLKASCDKLPTSLVLITNDKKVIGHCKLTAIPNLPESCFMESVVISKELRGKKLGTFLMGKAEEYCKNTLSLKTVHLSTKGQELFYSKLGYEQCAPISIYGSCFPFNISFKKPTIIKKQSTKTSETKTTTPPPPPPPMPKRETQNSNNTQTNKIFMYKLL